MGDGAEPAASLRGAKSKPSNTGRLNDYIASVSSVRSSSPRPSQADTEPVIRALNVGVGSCSFVLGILTRHPFIVVRRQCQISHASAPVGLSPFSPLRTALLMWRLQREQGAHCLYKGLSSCCIQGWLEAAFAGVITAATPCPVSLEGVQTLHQLVQYLSLKSVCTLCSLPFYSSSLLETIQSQVTSDGEPSVIEFFQVGFQRAVAHTPHYSRRTLLPLWSCIALPALIYAILHDGIVSGVSWLVLRVRQHFSKSSVEKQPRTLPIRNDSSAMFWTRITFPELLARTASHVVADALLYPLETVLHRLHTQGTRAIIDNVETGVGILPHDSSYLGFWDCVRTVRQEEGVGGFYKGFSAILLQAAAEALLLHLTRISFQQVNNSNIFKSEHQQPPSQIH